MDDTELENKWGKEVPQEELRDAFPAPEGSSNMYYGKIRSGKTYGATCDIIDELKQGRVVYATWPIEVEDFDDRDNIFLLLINWVLLRKRFYKIPCEKNLHWLDVERGEVDGIPTWNPKRGSEYIEYLNTLTHCSLYLDEAWRVLDSYQGTNMSLAGRDLVLVTGHKFRTVNLIAQRPTSVHVSARGNINRFYKFVKIASWPWVRFARYEFQEMVGETVNEDAEPESIKTYWARKEIFEAYNSYFYGGKERTHPLALRAFDLGFHARSLALLSWFVNIYAKLRHKIADSYDSLRRLFSKGNMS